VTGILTLLSHARDNHLAGISVKLFVCQPSTRPVLQVVVMLILGVIDHIHGAVRMQTGHFFCIGVFFFKGGEINVH
jgi:hypothetical protein